MLSEFLTAINSSRVLLALSTITMQFGARHVIGDLTEMQNKFLANKVVKHLIIFAMIFVVTRDVIMAVILTVAIYAVLGWLLNENSCFCVVPDSLRPNKKVVSEVVPGQDHTDNNTNNVYDPMYSIYPAINPSLQRQQRQKRCLRPPRLWHPMRTNPMAW